MSSFAGPFRGNKRKADQELEKKVALHNKNIRNKRSKKVNKASTSSSSCSSSSRSSTSRTDDPPNKEIDGVSSDPFEIETPANVYRNLRSTAFTNAFTSASHNSWFEQEHPDLLQTMEDALKESKPSSSNGRVGGGGGPTQLNLNRNNHKRQKMQKQLEKPKQQNNKQTIEEKMKAHNMKFKKKSTYEPRKHSARDVRMWESKTKKKWSTLNVDERIAANAEIALLKKTDLTRKKQ
jgi:hypothetical protein